MPRALVSAFVLGLLFGVGLVLAGMTDPQRVQGFLDVAGAWDPTLAFVMGAALVVATPLFRIARRREQGVCGTPMMLPSRQAIDRRLVAGSAVFGVGWGLAGFCPGPAIVDMGAGIAGAWWFGGAMVAGMLVYGWLARPPGALQPTRLVPQATQDAE
ncbi:MAG: YeeE/YedE family protein [Proteobacteria bacterium]|nr:YeeE/YedE family protein [Pseudomonadota bacterium]